jgi:hypothetical protein
MATPDKKVTINFETTADLAGAKAAEEAIDAVQAAANGPLVPDAGRPAATPAATDDLAAASRRHAVAKKDEAAAIKETTRALQNEAAAADVAEAQRRVTPWPRRCRVQPKGPRWTAQTAKASAWRSVARTP